METVSINVMNLCVPCENRCRYCLLSYDGKVSGNASAGAFERKRSAPAPKRPAVSGKTADQTSDKSCEIMKQTRECGKLPGLLSFAVSRVLPGFPAHRRELLWRCGNAVGLVGGIL